MLINVFIGLIESLIRNISGGLGRRIRYSFYKRRLGSCGKNVIIDIGVVILNPEAVYVGSDIWLDNYVLIMAGKPGNERKILIKDNPAYKFERGELHIGDRVHISPFCVLQAHGGISIGANSSVASGSKLYSFSHHYRNLHDADDSFQYHFTSMAPKNEQFLISAPVVMGESSAVGLNSTVLPGTHIPDGTWLGVQTYAHGQNIESDSIYTGAPAQFSKSKI